MEQVALAIIYSRDEYSKNDSMSAIACASISMTSRPASSADDCVWIVPASAQAHNHRFHFHDATPS
uniref:hypothetical protein n=1 Tax=Burkholderia anthina TaxID=179879 RepID=UPI00158B3244|nr:hypothetical protein [Burkholderia anthina]